MTRENAGVGFGRLVADDFDRVEHLAQPGLRQLAFLVQQIALGHKDQPMPTGQCLDRIGNPRQQVDGVGQHLLPRRDDLPDNGTRHPPLGDLDRGFDHRQHKALDAKTIMTKVAPLGGQQSFGKMVAIRMVGQELGKARLRQVKDSFVVPERVIGIEANQIGAHWRMSGLEYRGRVFMAGHCAIYFDQIESVTPGFWAMATPTTMTERRDGAGPGDPGLAVKTRTRTQRPPMYKVMLLNDDYTPMEFVVHVLERFFGLSHAQAFEIMLTVHKKGLAVVGVYSHEIAETKVAQVMDFARRHQHPLQCTLEKE